MVETHSPEEGPQKEVRELETLEEKLDFIRTRFIDETETVKVTPEVFEPGDELAEVEFSGDLFIGELNEETANQIASVLGVNVLQDDPDFRLTGEMEFDVFETPEAESFYLLVRTVEDETEILFYDFIMVEGIEMSLGLERSKE